MTYRTSNELPKAAGFSPSPLPPALPGFDLTPVMDRVRKEHSDWTKSRLAEAEHGYRRFLAGAKACRKDGHRPEADVDEVWHAHILFTEQYHADCARYFGLYFHHRPFDSHACSHGCQGGPCNGACTSFGAGTMTT
jgi:hypothetical protein